MSDPVDGNGDGASGPSLSEEITRSLGSVWARHASSRPGAVNTEIRDHVVECVFTDAVASFNAGPQPEEGEDATESRVSNPAGYRQAAIATVSRLTERRVVGFIPKHDEKTDVATEKFILERAPRIH